MSFSSFSLALLKIVKLRDIWANSVQEKGDDWTRIDVLPDISRMTLDVIGLAGMWPSITVSHIALVVCTTWVRPQDLAMSSTL